MMTMMIIAIMIKYFPCLILSNCYLSVVLFASGQHYVPHLMTMIVLMWMRMETHLVWNFNKNSSVLEVRGFPNSDIDCDCDHDYSKTALTDVQ